MKFKDFFKKGLVRKASENKELAKSLIKNSKEDRKLFKNIEINEISSRKVMSNYYDILRSILEAISEIKGYKIYSHEAFTYFLKEILDENNFSIKFNRFRKIRNSINYYGEDISVEDTKENINKIGKMIDDLVNKYPRNLEK